MDVAGRYVAILLAVILILLFPLQYIAQAQSETMDNAVNSYATEFTETARHQGYITLDMYQTFINKLNQTGEIYEVTLKSAHPVTGKEVAFNEPGDKMPVLRTENTSFIKTEDKIYKTSEGVKVLSTYDDEIYSLSTHIHTDACYVGHNHTANGCVSALCDCGGTSVNLVVIRTSSSLTLLCKCTKCGRILLRGTAIYNNTNTRYSISVFVPGSAGLQEIINYYQKILRRLLYEPR